MTNEVLHNDPKALTREYDRLYNLFNEDNTIDIFKWCSIREYISECFRDISIRGTCLTLNEYDDEHGYNFNYYIPPNTDALEHLISFCKYSYNLVFAAIKAERLSIPSRLIASMKKPMDFYIDQVLSVIEKIGYMPVEADGITDFVPKSPTTIMVAENLEPNLSNLILRYKLHSLKGNLEEKAIILYRLGKKLEGDRDTLSNFNNDFEKDLFTLLNSIDIRHNNIAESSKNYKEYVANMGKDQLEEWYDNTYQLVLHALLIMEYIERRERISILRRNLKKN